jgi:transcriptional regulator with XRE-family HTH domain
MRNPIVQKILDRTPKETTIFVKHYAALAKRIYELLEEKGWTQKELAEKMEKTPSEINKWLNNEHNLTLRSIAKLEAVFETSLIEVLSHETTVHKQQKSFSVKVVPLKKETDMEQKKVGNFVKVPKERLIENLEKASGFI